MGPFLGFLIKGLYLNDMYILYYKLCIKFVHMDIQRTDIRCRPCPDMRVCDVVVRPCVSL